MDHYNTLGSDRRLEGVIQTFRQVPGVVLLTSLFLIWLLVFGCQNEAPVSYKAVDLVAFQGPDNNNELRWGYRLATGKVVIPPRWHFVGRFYNDQALVGTFIYGNWEYQIVDSAGNIVMDRLFAEARTFADGLAAVRLGEQYGFIDSTGRIVIPCEYSYVTDFQSGLCAAGGTELSDFTTGGPCLFSGIMDHQGKWIIKVPFSRTSNYSSGLACVVVFPYETAPWDASQYLEIYEGETKTGYIDKKGNWAIKPIPGFGESFEGGLAVFHRLFPGGKGMINKLGNFQIPCIYRDIEHCNIENMVAVQDSAKRWGFTDTLGNWRIPARFEHIASNWENHTCMVILGQMYRIDTLGRIIGIEDR